MKSNYGGARVCATRKMAVPIGMRLRKQLTNSTSHYNISDLSRFTSKCKMVPPHGQRISVSHPHYTGVIWTTNEGYTPLNKSITYNEGGPRPKTHFYGSKIQ